jgi:hypothetical protein
VVHFFQCLFISAGGRGCGLFFYSKKNTYLYFTATYIKHL